MAPVCGVPLPGMIWLDPTPAVRGSGKVRGGERRPRLPSRPRESEMSTSQHASPPVATPIALDEHGIPWIEGTRTKVIEVVLNQEWSGQSAEELQRDLPHLTVAQVHAALSYYSAHQEELDADIARRERLVEEVRSSGGASPVAERLRASGKLR